MLLYFRLKFDFQIPKVQYYKITTKFGSWIYNKQCLEIVNQVGLSKQVTANDNKIAKV